MFHEMTDNSLCDSLESALSATVGAAVADLSLVEANKHPEALSPDLGPMRRIRNAFDLNKATNIIVIDTIFMYRSAACLIDKIVDSIMLVNDDSSSKLGLVITK
jgi:hypothetical protein